MSDEASDAPSPTVWFIQVCLSLISLAVFFFFIQPIPNSRHDALVYLAGMLAGVSIGLGVGRMIYARKQSPTTKG